MQAVAKNSYQNENQLSYFIFYILYYYRVNLKKKCYLKKESKVQKISCSY